MPENSFIAILIYSIKHRSSEKRKTIPFTRATTTKNLNYFPHLSTCCWSIGESGRRAAMIDNMGVEFVSIGKVQRTLGALVRMVFAMQHLVQHVQDIVGISDQAVRTLLSFGFGGVTGRPQYLLLLLDGSVLQHCCHS